MPRKTFDQANRGCTMGRHQSISLVLGGIMVAILAVGL